MPFVDSAGARIHWESEGQGTPVLLIMGHLYDSSMWYPLLPALTQTHRAIWFDNRGVGESDTTGKVDIAQFAADALAVLDAAGAVKAHIYGVSMGGCIATEFAVRYPERVQSLTLGCTAMKIEVSPIALILISLMYRLPRATFHKTLLSRAKPSAYGSAAPAEAVARDLTVVARLKFTMRGLRAQVEAMKTYAADPAALRRLRMPVLVLHGDEDAVVDLKGGRALHAAIPQSRMQVLHGAGHNYLVACNAQSTAAALDLFAEADRRAAA